MTINFIYSSNIMLTSRKILWQLVHKVNAVKLEIDTAHSIFSNILNLCPFTIVSLDTPDILSVLVIQWGNTGRRCVSNYIYHLRC